MGIRERWQRIRARKSVTTDRSAETNSNTRRPPTPISPPIYSSPPSLHYQRQVGEVISTTPHTLSRKSSNISFLPKTLTWRFGNSSNTNDSNHDRHHKVTEASSEPPATTANKSNPERQTHRKTPTGYPHTLTRLTHQEQQQQEEEGPFSHYHRRRPSSIPSFVLNHPRNVPPKTPPTTNLKHSKSTPPKSTRSKSNKIDSFGPKLHCQRRDRSTSTSSEESDDDETRRQQRKREREIERYIFGPDQEQHQKMLNNYTITFGGSGGGNGGGGGDDTGRERRDGYDDDEGWEGNSESHQREKERRRQQQQQQKRQSRKSSNVSPYTSRPGSVCMMGMDEGGGGESGQGVAGLGFGSGRLADGGGNSQEATTETDGYHLGGLMGQLALDDHDDCLGSGGGSARGQM